MSNENKGSVSSEDLLPLTLKSIVTSAERLEKMNINTDTIVAKLSNGIGSDIRSIVTILRNEVMPKLNLETALVEAKKVEAEINAKYKIEEVKAKKEMYNTKYKFFSSVAGLLLGSSGFIITMIKWVIPFMKEILQ